MRLYILLIILTILCQRSAAQNWKQQNDSVITYYNNKDFLKALEVAERNIGTVKKEFGEAHENYLMTLEMLATIYKKNKEYIKAASSWAILIGVYEKTDSLKYAEALNQIAMVHEAAGKYEAAETNYTKSIKVYVANGTADIKLITVLNNLADFYETQNMLAKAIDVYVQVTTLEKIALGKNHPDLAASFNLLGNAYVRNAEYKNGEAAYNQSLEISKKIMSGTNVDYARALNNMAELYRTTGRYEEAEPLLLQSLSIWKDLIGEDNFTYATFLNNSANLYNAKSFYKKADSLYTKALGIIKKIAGEENTAYANSLSNIGYLYTKMGLYEKASNAFNKVLAIQLKIVGKENVTYANGLNNLAMLYLNFGQYDKAESSFEKVLEINKKLYGEKNPAVAKTLNNLAGLYTSTAAYSKAEQFFIQSIEIYKTVFGENHPDYAQGLNNLASLYQDIGQFEKAEQLFLQSKEIRKNIFGESHPEYGIALNNLGNFYNQQGFYNKADSFFFQAENINEKVFGKNNVQYAMGLLNRANVYLNWGLFDKAEEFYLQAIQVFKYIYGIEHIQYASAINNLAYLYMQQGQLAKAAPLFMLAKDIWKKKLGEKNPSYATALENLAMVYQTQGQYLQAENLLKEIKKIQAANLFSTLGILSEKEKGNYISNSLTLNNIQNSFLFNYRKASSSFIRGNYDIQLLLKSLALLDTKNVFENISSNKDSSVQQMLSQWQLNKTILSKQYSLPVSDRMENLGVVEEQTEAQEKKLSRLSVLFNTAQKSLKVETSDVQKKLESGEVAIEFVRFRLFNKQWTDSIIYAAYILNKTDSIPLFVPLCEERQLQQLLDSAGRTATSRVNNFYRGLEIKNKNNAFLGKELYRLVWAPLEPYLKGIKKIAYSPAGKLYGVAFNALSADSSSLLIDKYNLQQYTSTRQIAFRTIENQLTKPASIVLFGDANFSMDSTAIARQRTVQKENISTTAYRLQNRNNENGVWNNLPGTATEVKKIAELFKEHAINTQSFVQEAASEENLKALTNNGPQVLHIATHGFFLPDPTKMKKETGFNQGNSFSLADDPLFRSGLILAGGNYVWSNKKPIDGVEDGIATAYEISQLNLSNTELIVLSACETALGDVKGSEGVFGLQRAFKMAGVKKMIVSLWQVPDKETAELMTSFYSYWMKGKTITDAFSQAQADMRKKYSPFYWAAFVLVE